MSDDLISRSALVKEIENMKVPYGNDNESYISMPISMPRVLDIISEQPTAEEEARGEEHENIDRLLGILKGLESTRNITYEIDCYKHKYCPECGQAISWEGEE